MQSEARQSKAKQGKARQSKAKPGRQAGVKVQNEFHEPKQGKARTYFALKVQLTSSKQKHATGSKSKRQQVKSKSKQKQ